MRKYWYFFKSHLSTRFEYRAEGFLWALIELVMLSFAIFVWTAIYRDNQMVGNYTLAQMILYYALIPIVGNLVYVHGLTTYLAKNIKDGQIAIEVIKPYNVSFNHFLKSTSVKVFQMLVKMPIFLSAIIFVSLQLKIQLSPVNILVGVAICLLVYIMHFFLDLTIAFTAFWFEEVWSLYHLKSILVTVFGGLAFPLALVPTAWQSVFNFVPLRFIYNFPISVFQGRLSNQEITTGVITICAWTVFFWFLSQLLWHQGLKRFSAHGG